MPRGVSQRKLALFKLGGRVLENFIQKPEMIDWTGTGESDFCFVHGGGAAINERAEQLGLQFQFVDGQRVTSPEVVDVVESVLRGEMNPSLVRALENSLQQSQLTKKVLGLSASDAGMLKCSLENPAWGLVGKVESCDSSVASQLISLGHIPVIAPLGSYKSEKREIVNCNADVGAVAIASSLEVDQLVFLSDTDGVWDADQKTIPHLTCADIDRLIQEGVIQGGMHVKMQSIQRYLKDHQNSSVWLVNGLKPLKVSELLNNGEIEGATRISYAG